MKDQTFVFTSRIARPAAEVFAWHERPGALARLCPPWEKIRIVAATGGVRDGARVTLRNRVGPFWTEWRVEHLDYIAGAQFRDVQLAGPFAKWEHLHRIVPDGPEACQLTDDITYRLPGGTVGNALGRTFTERTLFRLFSWRHAVTKADLEQLHGPHGSRPLRIAIAGGSGLIGGTLIPLLETQGHHVLRLVRRRSDQPDEISWNPAAGMLDAASLEGVDAIVNLSGENVGAGRWTTRRRQAIRESRMDATRTLVAAVKTMRRKPRVFVSASAVGVYGDRGYETLDEHSAPGHGFLADVCREWEQLAMDTEAVGLRAATLRLGVVLSPAGGALRKLRPVFLAGLGGRLGSGAQWMSWASIDDVVAAFYHALVNENCRGPVNVVAPEPVKNREFAATLAGVLDRPAILPVPAVVLRGIFGEMADATLLASTRAVPRGLTETGYRFRHPDLESALRHVLGRPQI